MSRPAAFPSLVFSPVLTETPQMGAWSILKMPRFWSQPRTCELDTLKQGPAARLQGDPSVHTALLASGVREPMEWAQSSACKRPGSLPVIAFHSSYLFIVMFGEAKL